MQSEIFKFYLRESEYANMVYGQMTQPTIPKLKFLFFELSKSNFLNLERVTACLGVVLLEEK